MDQPSIKQRRRRGTALALAALAGLALLLAWTTSGGVPDPTVLAQEGATSTSTWTPRPPFTSPLSTPVLIATAPPRPTPQPLRYITNPTEAYVLGQRYDHGQAPGGGQGAIPSDPSSASGEAVVQGSLFLPLVLTHGDWLWYKGAGKSHGYRPSSFMSQLRGSWWYDWQHDYTWNDYGNFAYNQFVPMVWCADLPGEPGVPLASSVEWLQGGGTGYEAVAWFVSINKLEDPNNLPLVRTMLFEYVPPPTSPSVLTTPGWYWANTDPMPAIAD